LTFDERMKLAERWVRVARGRLKVIVHVGHNSVADAVALAEHARSLKPFAVAAMPPTFFRPGSIDALVATCAEIASAAGSLPFYYYHIPSMTGVDLSMVRFLEAAGSAIPTLRGIKYTHNDLLEYRQCLALQDGRFDVPFGRDEMLLAALAYGATGAVGSTYNYAAPAYLKLMRAFAAGDLATCRAVADGVIKLVGVLRSLGEIPAGKAIMTTVGVELGPPRLPLRPLTAAQRAVLDGFLAETSLLDGGASRCGSNGNGKSVGSLRSVSASR
jgi:N-acetylneuraminate lyase